MALLVGVSSPVAAGNDQTAGRLNHDRVDRYVERYLQQAHLPGAIVAITHGGQVLRTAGYGRDSRGRELTAHSPMQVASLSKSMTSLALMQLVDHDQVDLAAPVHHYLPDFRLADPRYRDITVRQLLDQTSGMSDREFPAASETQPHTLREAVWRLRDARLESAPGTEHQYHNPNYHVAARLVEVVSGEPFSDYLRRHVFDPAGMSETGSVARAGDRYPGLAHGFIQAYGVNVAMPEPDQFSEGSGGVVSTAHDMAHWLALQNEAGRSVEGTRVVSAGAMREMHAPSDPRGRYGLGWMSREPDEGGHAQLWHGGAHSTFSAYQVLIPSTDFGVFVAFNRGIALSEDDVWGLVAGLIAMTEGRAPAPGDTVLWKVDLAFALATLVVLGLAVRGVVRSRRWAKARTSRRRWRAVSRLVPYTAPVVMLLAFPAFAQFLLGGRDGTWMQRFYAIPAELVFLTVAAAGCLAVVGARAVGWAHVRR